MPADATPDDGMKTIKDLPAACRALAGGLARALPEEPLEKPVQIRIRVPVRAAVEKWLGWDPADYDKQAETRLDQATSALKWLSVPLRPGNQRERLFPCRLESASGWALDDELTFLTLAGHPDFGPGVDFGEEEGAPTPASPARAPA